ncbi:peptide deformylase [Bacteroidales bacterium]|nr:peptide deformylase [Bacteroidales bacterium]
MILPIYVVGQPVLKKVAKDFEIGDDSVTKIIDDMHETMYNADGIGLAGPQVGLSKRIFVIDASPMGDDEPTLKDFKKVFLNAKITERTGESELIQEGCLSLPEIREEVPRLEHIKIEYYDENWNHKIEEYDGFAARVIQHEYDHLDGVLFVDKLSPLKRRLLKSRLVAISKGKIATNYRIKPV